MAAGAVLTQEALLARTSPWNSDLWLSVGLEEEGQKMSDPVRHPQ